jgi:hypothetical protein
VVDGLHPRGRDEILVLDMGTGEMRRVSVDERFLCEVDIASRLSAMKTFYLPS